MKQHGSAKPLLNLVMGESPVDFNLAVEPSFQAPLKDTLGSFLDITGTATGRATFYNSKEEQEAAEAAVHANLYDFDRHLYGALLTLPGVTERSRVLGLPRLLGHGDSLGILALDKKREVETENRILATLLDGVSFPRALRALVSLRDVKVNNARSRRIVMQTLFSPRGIEMRAVRFHGKMASALRHVLGKSASGVIGNIMSRAADSWQPHERKFVQDRVLRYVHGVDLPVLQVVVAFVLGKLTPFVTANAATPIISAFFAARKDLTKGDKLPFEVLEGIRSTYHRSLPASMVLELTQKNLTKGQQIRLQRTAEKANVEVAFDPARYDATQLYIYAFERGMTDEIRQALDSKAKAAAATLPFRFNKLAVIVDASASMLGDKTQRLRPMAIALAMSDMLQHVGTAKGQTVGGKMNGGLMQPSGDTSLAEALVIALKDKPEAVFIISDGYENAPAGRFADTVERVRGLAIMTPIIQLSPVAAAESAGLRRLSPKVASLPVSNPAGMTLPLLREMVQADVVGAATMLATIAFRALWQQKTIQ